MPIGPARMPLFDHLGELRRRLTIVVVSVFAAAIVLYFATPVVLDILEDPIRSFRDSLHLYTLQPNQGQRPWTQNAAIRLAIIFSVAPP